MKHLWLVLVLAAGCTADDFTKQGEVGEFCNGADTDCRDGLACIRGVCQTSGPGPTYDCDDICARLGECDAAAPGCQSDCRISTTGWALRAREEFGVCAVEELTCGEAQQADPPQTCYSRIEIPAARFELCERFTQSALVCGAPENDAERVLEACAGIARVQPDARWDRAATCASAIETGICTEVAQCFTRELELDPAIEFVNF